MRVVRYQQRREFAEMVAGWGVPAAAAPEVEATVRAIIAEVSARGDEALLELTRKFDGATLSVGQMRVNRQELAAARRSVDARTKTALTTAHRNVEAFARRSLRKSWRMKNGQGAQVGERFDAFERVGIYVPGGTAPLVSTALMTATLAAVAGVREIVVTTPASPSGEINPALLQGLQLAGATEIYKIGGAQAIAALAFGTATVRPVSKIFGPGNAYVVEAKRQVFGRVAIDLLPGPSEIFVIADKTANAAWIAADLLAQAEHGRGSRIVLATNSAKLLTRVESEIQKQAAQLTRQRHLREVLEQNAVLLLVRNMKEAVEIVNRFAPEHLSIVTRDDESLAAQVRTAGAIFLGGMSPVVGGDFVAGPSHELPTGGAGKSFAGLTVDQFQRRTSIVRFDERSLRRSLPAIAAFSAIEGLDAHGRSAAIRFK